MLAIAMAMLLAAGDGGVDVPTVIHLEGDYIVNESAWLAINTEVKRLQGVERVHKQEEWGGVLLVGGVVGAVLTAVILVPVHFWVLSAQKNPPNP